MAADGRNFLLMKRTWLGAAVAAGVLVGINIPEFWKGFGGSGTNPLGKGTQTVSENEPRDTEKIAATTNTEVVKPAAVETLLSKFFPTGSVPEVIKVDIAERSYALRTEAGERPAELQEVIALVKQAKGDADGIRLRIYRQPTARASAENGLQTALADAGIREDTVVWVPPPTE